MLGYSCAPGQSKKGVVLFDAGRPLEEVVSDIVEETLKWMEKRTDKRLGLKP